ncbi:hypothetical protein FGB62_113g10 [Gracilaria domingensis]|nr:hypothetical protein FGB62_113g10 [Gracilaria domingensis]
MDNLSTSAYVGGTALRTPSPCTFLPTKCPLRARLSAGKRLQTTRQAPCTLNTLSSASANRRDEAVNEEDDAVMGGQEHTFGMAMPNLTNADKDYLEAATSNGDYMRRMTDIIRKKDQERKAAMGKENAQGPDDYLESLARPTTPLADAAPPRVNAGDAYMEDLARKSRAERGIEDPPVEKHRSSTAPAGPVIETDKEEEADELESLEERINRLQESLARVKSDIDPNSTIEDAIAVQQEIRRDIGLDPPSAPVPKQMPEPTPKPTHKPATESTKPQAIDKQIDFLENYLDKLRQEEAEENALEDDRDAELPNEVEMKKALESNISQLADKFTPQIEGLGDTAGGMSAAEKIAAFQQIREKSMNASNQDKRFEDPFNTILPSKKMSEDDGEEPSPSSEAEYDEIGSHLHSKELLVEEIEVEVARYLTNAKDILEKHDARMQVLLARLKALQ